MSSYDQVEYWNDRYQRDSEPFDWYQRFQGLREHIISQVNTDNKILNIGAGTSRLCEELYMEGFQNVHNIDFSPVIVNIMKERYKEENLNFPLMDVRNMSEFKDKTFDTVIDKGTLDSIYCGENADDNIKKSLQQIYRVLKSKGVFMCLSHSQAEHRLSHLSSNEFNWKIQIHQLNKVNATIQIAISAEEQKDILNQHTLYICTKFDFEQ